MTGRLNLTRPLVLEAVTRVPDGAGGFAEAWAPLGTLWADLRARTGREARGETGPLSTVPYKITVRAMPQGAPSRPVAGQRFRDGARIFAILAVAESDPVGRYLTCFAEEELAQ
jgi:head-tail adaptor